MSGARTGRRAVFRWAWRLFQRDWRQQMRVLVLLTVAIVATVTGASAAYNLAPARGNAEFGTANNLFTYFEVADSESRDALLATAEDWFGAIDVITRREIAEPGTVDSIEFRGQNPRGAFSDPMLALLDGTYPTGSGEVAITNRVAETFSLDIGSSFELGGEKWTVVGKVENPSDLSDEFALTAPVQDEFPQSVTFLVDASPDRVDSFRPPNEMKFESNLIGGRPSQEAGFAVVMVLIIAVVALLLVSLVAAAGFAVVAQRRLRQLGMLAAIGATEAHLRLVMVANGVVIGMLAAFFGAAIGALAWVLSAPRIELVAGHRMDRFNMPWWLLAAAMLLALLTASLAAWWPARTLARVSVVRALSGRPPAAQPVRRSGALAGLLVPLGIALLAWADPSELAKETEAFGDPFHALLITAGTLATAAGVLLAGPMAIRALAATARWLPVAMRLALRDLVRFQARSAAALAAVSLALGIALAVVLTAAAAEPQHEEGNLSDRQLLVQVRDPDQPGFALLVPSAVDVENLESDVRAIAEVTEESSLTALDVAVDPSAEFDSGMRIPMGLSKVLENGDVEIAAAVYVAGPKILARYGIDFGALPTETEILTVETGNLWLTGEFDSAAGRFAQVPVTNTVQLDPIYSSIPGTFITPDGMRRRGWEPVRVAWLIETDSPFTGEQLAQARQIAAESGLLAVEARSGGGNLVAMRWPATAAGMLVALSVLAMTVGLIRGEAAGDLRSLAATGATSSIRPSLTAFTAGSLALLGALLGCAGAYLVLGSLYSGSLSELSQVPVVQLAVITLGTPLIGAVAGWLLAGREPQVIARMVIE